GLREIVVGSQLEGTYEIFLLATYRQHHDGYARIATDRLADLKAARPRHVDVEDDEIRRFVRYGLQCAGSVSGLDDEISCLRQREADEVAQITIVICHQNLHAVTSTGRLTVNRVRPLPVRSTATAPPWRSTIERTIQSPSPRPPASGSSPAPRRNGAKMSSVAAGPGPGPSSSTHASRLPFSSPAPILTMLPSGAYLLALASRLTNTWARRCLSPSM